VRSSYAIAAWIFELVGLDDGLAGDLLEERTRGRSRIWYWRQVLIAILISIYRAIRAHKGLALRAVATGCGINSLWILLVNFLHPWVPPFTVMSINPSNHPLVMVVLTQVATGWILVRTHRPTRFLWLSCSWFGCCHGLPLRPLRNTDAAGHVFHGGCPGAGRPHSWGDCCHPPQMGNHPLQWLAARRSAELSRS
jgi:hypothetical protein